jgi:hypothetical protein
MPKEVTVDLKDLRFLVKIMLGFSIESRAHKLLRQSQIPKNKAAVNRYMAALRVAIPQAKMEREKQFRDLLDAVKTGDNLRHTLATFAARVAKS